MVMDKISLALVIIGALNWGGVGLFRFDTVAWICGGQGSIVARIIYTLVALAGVWCISLLFREESPTSHGAAVRMDGGAAFADTLPYFTNSAVSRAIIISSLVGTTHTCTLLSAPEMHTSSPRQSFAPRSGVTPR